MNINYFKFTDVKLMKISFIVLIYLLYSGFEQLWPILTYPIMKNLLN